MITVPPPQPVELVDAAALTRPAEYDEMPSADVA